MPDYWACDFNWPEWAEYMADVADYWMRLGGLDGFRVDAAFGARYPNWNPAIPYARASFARLQGGFRMQRALRSAVMKVNSQGAILAEAEAGAFNAVSDATWDFTLGESVLPFLRKRTAAEAVPLMRRWLHERQKTLPPGSLMLRYAETHDLLRARDVYGQAAATALGALVAWIGEGVPVVNDGREVGSFEDLRRIASIRHAVPELNGGETDYLAPEAPSGVFACLRKGPGLAVPLVNLNGVRVAGDVRLPDGRTFKIDLPPLGFTVLRPDGGTLPSAPVAWTTVPATAVRAPEVGTGDSRLRMVVGGWMFDDGKLRVHLQRNGALRGVWRRENNAWRRLSGSIYLKAEGEKTYDQASDVEPIATLSREDDGTLRLLFDGVLRNIRRTGKMPHGTSYHTAYTLGGTAGVVIETSFKVDAAGKGSETVLTMDGLDDGVKTTISRETTPERFVHGTAADLKWIGGPGATGGATFIF